MSIRSVGNPYGPQRPAAPAPTTGVKGAPAERPGAPAAGTPARPAARQDSVAISDAGRALAGGETSQAAGGLTPSRTNELRRKVLEGAYDQAHVVDQVAKRLLSSGDV